MRKNHPNSLKTRMRVFTVAAMLLTTVAGRALAELDEATLKDNKERAIAAARKLGYLDSTLLGGPEGRNSNLRLLTEWILGQANTDSAMRDQMADELAEIEGNGKNSAGIIACYKRDETFERRLCFRPSDVRVTRTGGGKDGIHDYEAVLRALNAYRGGATTKSFRFTFKVKTFAYKNPKTFGITAVSYPLYEGSTESE